jgi:long-chain acyl-CoA synthetase
MGRSDKKSHTEPTGEAADSHTPNVSVSFVDGVEVCEYPATVAPDTPSIFYFSSTISNRQAREDATALAGALKSEFGVTHGDRVALMMQNVPQMAISIHAVWLLGAIVIPVNVMCKRRELLHQLNDSGAVLIICHESYYEDIASIKEDTSLMHIVTVSELDYLDEVPDCLSEVQRLDCSAGTPYAELVSGHRGSALARASLDPSSPALITYTSGTTGLSKGAINTHGAVAHNAMVWRDWYELDGDDVVVAAAPLFHITGLMGSFAASRASGAPLLLAFRFDAGDMLRLIEQWRGTWIVASLTAFIALLEHPSFTSRDLTSLTKVASGGAPVLAAVADRFEQATGLYLHNAYGLTETTSTAVLVPLGARAPIDPEDGALSVGVAVPGAELRVVRMEDGEDAQLGERGELLVKGPMVTPGYWMNPSATEAAIVDGWLRTGDVAKCDEHGWYWIVDRLKDMIISSGFKVWPREVEDVLFSHPAVAEASVAGVPDDYRGERVVAFVVLRRDFDENSMASIEAHCRENLAAYKVPRSIFLVEQLPKTASGKVLRRELRVEAQRLDRGDSQP